MKGGSGEHGNVASSDSESDGDWEVRTMLFQTNCT
jgi:hypothetical protein